MGQIAASLCCGVDLIRAEADGTAPQLVGTLKGQLNHIHHIAACCPRASSPSSTRCGLSSLCITYGPSAPLEGPGSEGPQGIMLHDLVQAFGKATKHQRWRTTVL
jgi:hypothetical protein